MQKPAAVLPAFLGAIAAALTLAACGGSESPANAAAGERAQEQSAEVRFQDFAKCLREHGVNAEAISHPGSGHGLKVGPGSSGPAGMEAAEKACARYRPAPKAVNLSPQQRVEREEAVQKFARCMREHGIKVQATAKGGGVQIAIHAKAGGNEGPDPESPAFRQAQATCQKLLPGGGPGGGPKGGPKSFAPAGGSEGSAGAQSGGASEGG
jgi:hypothetical protein